MTTRRPFHKPPTGFALDHEQGRVRIGLLALVNDYVVELDMMAMRPDGDEVTLYTARVPFEGDCDAESLAAMAGRLSGAADSILPGGRLDAVIYACASGTATIGYPAVARSIHAVRPGAACVTPITAAQAAFATLGVRNIAVLTPYTDDVTERTVEALEAASAEPPVRAVKITNFDIARSDDISAVTPRSIVAGALAADAPEAEGLFISCTDFRAAQGVEEIEARLGKPVVTANQACFWQAIRLAGYNKPIVGFGRLLAC